MSCLLYLIFLPSLPNPNFNLNPEYTPTDQGQFNGVYILGLILLTKNHVVKAVITYGLKARPERRQNAKEMMPSNSGAREEPLGQQVRPNQSILKEINA